MKYEFCSINYLSKFKDEYENHSFFHNIDCGACYIEYDSNKPLHIKEFVTYIATNNLSKKTLVVCIKNFYDDSFLIFKSFFDTVYYFFQLDGNLLFLNEFRSLSLEELSLLPLTTDFDDNNNLINSNFGNKNNVLFLTDKTISNEFINTVINKNPSNHFHIIDTNINFNYENLTVHSSNGNFNKKYKELLLSSQVVVILFDENDFYQKFEFNNFLVDSIYLRKKIIITKNYMAQMVLANDKLVINIGNDINQVTDSLNQIREGNFIQDKNLLEKFVNLVTFYGQIQYMFLYSNKFIQSEREDINLNSKINRETLDYLLRKNQKNAVLSNYDFSQSSINLSKSKFRLGLNHKILHCKLIKIGHNVEKNEFIYVFLDTNSGEEILVGISSDNTKRNIFDKIDDYVIFVENFDGKDIIDNNSFLIKFKKYIEKSI